MKTVNTSASYKTFLVFALFFGNVFIVSSETPPPPPPYGLEEAPPVSIDLYMIPMVIIGIVFAFFYMRKNTNI